MTKEIRMKQAPEITKEEYQSMKEEDSSIRLCKRYRVLDRPNQNHRVVLLNLQTDHQNPTDPQNQHKDFPELRFALSLPAAQRIANDLQECVSRCLTGKKSD